MHGFHGYPMHVPGFSGYPMQDPQSDSASRKKTVTRLSREDESSKSDEESRKSDEKGSESDEDVDTTPVENKKCPGSTASDITNQVSSPASGRNVLRKTEGPP
ncbi:hypothetical protein Tco_1067146 [Tanacetum coccineum]|uniref:Uncharacterized protein n=1 Tax=Tanacetum coccineum TaxID=301880 RepID=A0ABQ5HCW6_9ASTR